MNCKVKSLDLIFTVKIISRQRRFNERFKGFLASLKEYGKGVGGKPLARIDSRAWKAHRVAGLVSLMSDSSSRMAKRSQEITTKKIILTKDCNYRPKDYN